MVTSWPLYTGRANPAPFVFNDLYGGHSRIRTYDFHRVKVPQIKLFNDLHACGDCLNTRKPCRTVGFVGLECGLENCAPESSMSGEACQEYPITVAPRKALERGRG
jgi:hypothetical protein